MIKMAKWPASRQGGPNGSKPGILVITHYAKLLHYLKPDYIHVMKDGKIIESGGIEVGEKVEKEGYVTFRSDKAI